MLVQPVNSRNPAGVKLEIFPNAGKTARRKKLEVPVGVEPGNLLKEIAQKVDIERGQEI